MTEDIFISERSPVSDRYVVFEEDDYTGWMYLTDQNSKPIADCWIYNKYKALPFLKLKENMPVPPPAAIEYVHGDYLRPDIAENDITFKWSKDGNSVCMYINKLPIGYILDGEKRGYSRNLVRDCDWGNEFNQEKYQLYFGCSALNC